MHISLYACDREHAQHMRRSLGVTGERDQRGRLAVHGPRVLADTECREQQENAKRGQDRHNHRDRPTP